MPERPMKEFACGLVRATIWENEHENQEQKYRTYSVRIERRYKDPEDNWQGTNGFRKSDLPAVELVARKAHEFLTLRERDPQNEPNGEDPEA